MKRRPKEVLQICILKEELKRIMKETDYCPIDFLDTIEVKLNKSDVISSLDLNESERKLDDALAKETTESLNEWLNEKRQ